LIKLSVIIVNYNVAFFLEQCLISVQAACTNIISEIIVVDNNSSDESCSMIRQNFSSIKLVENKKNIGFSKANNIGIEQAKGEFILILNPDTVLAENTLEDVISYAERQNKLGAIGVRFIDGTGNFLPECKRNTPTMGIASRKLMGDSKRYYASQIAENEVAKVEILTGAFMLLKREVYLKIGGFDEDYFMFGEDIDLSYKLLNNGFQNFYFGKTKIIHYKGESTVKDKTYLKNFYGAMLIFYEKHFNTNTAYKIMLKNALKALILIKAVRATGDNSPVAKKSKILFISKDPKKYEKIRSKLKSVEVVMSPNLPDDISLYGKIIFDNSFFTFKSIFQYFIKLQSDTILLRIIPKNTSFFIGSDSSNDKGEVFRF